MNKFECPILLEDLQILYARENFTTEQAIEDYKTICGDVENLVKIINYYNNNAEKYVKGDSLLQYIYDNSTELGATNYEKNNILDFNYNSLCATIHYVDKYKVYLNLKGNIEVWSPTFEKNDFVGLIGMYDFIEKTIK